jgi:acetyl-CoA carboxylase biotin carboxylase subunit
MAKFYFIEMNTRLQVEHPVTEMITGSTWSTSSCGWPPARICRSRRMTVRLLGPCHRMPDQCGNPQTFTPSPGIIGYYHPPGGLGVRVDSGVYQGYRIPPYYDSLIGKLIVHGKTRNECLMRLRRALGEFVVDGIEHDDPVVSHAAQPSGHRRWAI